MSKTGNSETQAAIDAATASSTSTSLVLDFTAELFAASDNYGNYLICESSDSATTCTELETSEVEIDVKLTNADSYSSEP